MKTEYQFTRIRKPFRLFFLYWVAMQGILASCTEPTNRQPTTESVSEKGESRPAGETPRKETPRKDTPRYREGSDYLLFERVRILDKTGFTQPQEAYSVLLPKGWQHEGEIVWNTPQTSCSGTFQWLKAQSRDGQYHFELYPDIVYTWNTNAQVMQLNQHNGSASPNCAFGQPMDAEQYLRNVFAREELGNPEILTVAPNSLVVEQMQQSNEASKRELMQYGAGQMEFYQTAINAQVRWTNGTEGWVVLGMNTLETVVPNTYNGTYDKIYTSQVVKRTVFKYPASENEPATNQFGVVMASFRTNPAWSEAVAKFWKEVRQQRQIVHLGRIKMMDEQTRAMGDAAIRNGEARLKSMDTDLRNWEARQNDQDRMHTSFIKTIREVENYQDATGKIELASGYDHAWSRGDGSTFVVSNNANFDPAFVFQDQHWQAMKKVD